MAASTPRQGYDEPVSKKVTYHQPACPQSGRRVSLSRFYFAMKRFCCAAPGSGYLLLKQKNQLSTHSFWVDGQLVGPRGIKPLTSAMSMLRSNQLSYEPSLQTRSEAPGLE